MKPKEMKRLGSGVNQHSSSPDTFDVDDENRLGLEFDFGSVKAPKLEADVLLLLLFSLVRSLDQRVACTLLFPESS